MTLQTLPDDGDESFTTRVGNVAGFSLHAGVATKRLSMTRNGRVRYELNQE